MKKLILLLLILGCYTTGRAEIQAWVHPYLQPMVKEAPPPAESEKEIRIRVTPGEYEPASFAVRSSGGAVAQIAFSGRGRGGGPPVEWCEIHSVESLSESTQPNRLHDFSGTVHLHPEITQFFWITVHPPEDARPGFYRGTISITCESSTRRIGISCEVLPFRLRENPVTGGVFMASTNLPVEWYRDMKEHGLEAIQFFWSGTRIRITREGNRPVLDFSGMDEFMEKVTEAGLCGPVTISLGNDHSLHYERRLAEAFDLEILTGEEIGGKRVIGPAVSPLLDSLFVEGLRQIRDHWKRKAWPQELVVLIYDEPTERLLERCKHRYDLLKTVMPDTRVYGVVMNRRSWTLSMVDQCDIVVSDGDFLGCLEVARTYGKDYWVYSFPLSTVHGSRYDMGCMPWRVEADGTFFWMYNYWGYNSDGCAVYPNPVNPARPVRSTPWEGVREGMDDLRYFATLEHLLKSAPTGIKEEMQARLEKVKASIHPHRRARTPTGEAHDERSVLAHYSEPQRIRDEVIGIIMELLLK